jgi:hypothetical protein
MSKITLVSPISGTAEFSITTPSGTSTDRTLTLPDNSGTVQTELTNGFGFRNRIINGDMRIDQRNAGAAVTTTGESVYFVDRWTGFRNNAGWSVQQVADAPSGFVNSLRVTTTTANAGSVALIQQWFEGNNVSDLMLGTASAATFTVSFWVKSSVTGTFTVNLANGATNRSYVATYTVNSASTWEYKTITVSGDTTGTWATNNTAGLRVLFNIGTGGSATTAGSWQAGDLIRTSGSVGIEGTLNATWQITGVQLEAGSVATAFERRPFGTELLLCQRYYEISQATWSGYGNGSSNVIFSAPMKVSKRASPTVTLGADSGGWTQNFPSPTLVLSENSISINTGSTPSAGLSRYNAALTIAAEL